jgi:ADP-heptose:LPS heptosyltransferase
VGRGFEVFRAASRQPDDRSSDRDGHEFAPGGKIIEDIFLDVARQYGNVRRHRFDVALDMQGLLKSARLPNSRVLLNAGDLPARIFENPRAAVFYTDTVKFGPQTHVIRRNSLLAAQALGFEPTENDLQFPIFTDENIRLRPTR